MLGIGKLEKRIEELENEKLFIGELWCRKYDIVWGNIYFDFKKIKRIDIEEEHKGEYKIFGEWHKKENVLFYDEVYDFRRDMIKKLNKEKK